MPYQPYQNMWANPYSTTNPYGQSPILPTVQPYQQPMNGITKVNGRDSALQYQLPPNSTSPALFDNSGTCFYIVSTDGTGTKTVETFDFTPHVEQPVAPSEYVSRSEFQEMADKVEQLMGVLNGIHEPVQTAAATTGQPA